MVQSPSSSGPGAAEQRRPRLSSRRRRILLTAAYVAVAAVAFGASLAFTMAWRLVSGLTVDEEQPEPGDVVAPPRVEVRPDEPFNILILGTDAGLLEDGRRGARRSDTMMLASYDPLTGGLSILSIPRDTYVEIPLDRLDEQLHRYIRENPTKITHAHAFGGPAVSMAAVSHLLNVPVHRYVRVNLEAFVNIVDLMGGVYICVPKPMHYEDPYQNLYIHLQPGCRVLNGNEAMQYARYRQDSDLARIARQQEIIRALVQRGLDLGIIPRLGQIVDEIVRQVDTNLSESELVHLVAVAGRMAAGFSPDEIVMNTIPGRDGWMNGVYYWLHDEEGTRQLVDALIWRLTPPPDTVVQVLVRDASGPGGAGSRVAESLRQHGYNVEVVVDEVPVDETIVLIHHGDETMGKVLARAIVNQTATARVYAEPDDSAPADITIVVGRDYVQNQQ